VIARSVTRRAVVVATEALLVALVSSGGLVAVTVAVLAMRMVSARVRSTAIVKACVALSASVQKPQVTVPAVLAHPALDERKLASGCSASVTVTPLELVWSLLVTVGEYGVLLSFPTRRSSDLVIARSVTRRAVVVATEALLVALVSSVRLVAVTVAVLAM